MKKKIKYTILIIISIFLSLILLGLISELTGYNSVEAKEIKKIKIKKEIKKYYYVDIKGAIKNPGVYKLIKNSRVNDVINTAGGLLENSDTSIINLSKKIKDEMVIIIYTKEELENLKKEIKDKKEIEKTKQEEIICPDKSNDACINENKSINTQNENTLISLNTATKEELMTLTGVGESKAISIIEYREKIGGFKTIEEIKEVNGIGDSLFEKIKDYITI